MRLWKLPKWENGLTPILIDTTVLVNFAAVGRLELLRILFDKAYVAYSVYEEIQTGLDEGYKFLVGIETFIQPFHQDGWIVLTMLEDEEEYHLYEQMPTKLHRGEAMSLAIASKRAWRLLTDDRAARAHAQKMKVAVSGTLGVLVQIVKLQYLDISEANYLLAEMIRKANYRSPVTDIRLLINNQT
jgi:predicted nucleic acid-binding protein